MNRTGKIASFALITFLILSMGFFIGFLSYTPIQRIRVKMLAGQRQIKEENRLREGFINKRAPEISSETLDGNKWTLAEQRGKVVAVYFWSILCGGCIETLPLMNDLQVKYGKREDFLLVGVHRFPEKDIIACYCSAKGISWPQLFEGGESGTLGFTKQIGLKSTPSIVLIDKAGIVRGINPDFEKMEGVVRDLLEAKSDS